MMQETSLRAPIPNSSDDKTLGFSSVFLCSEVYQPTDHQQLSMRPRKDFQRE